MKRNIVINGAGDILAMAAYHREDSAKIPAAGEPPLHKYLPLPGQTVHVIELPDDLENEKAISGLHLTHKVLVVAGAARLEPRR
jgi:hypothetical protein